MVRIRNVIAMADTISLSMAIPVNLTGKHTIRIVKQLSGKANPAFIITSKNLRFVSEIFFTAAGVTVISLC